jgi:hypothetical protein
MSNALAVLTLIALMVLATQLTGAEGDACPLPSGHTGAEGHCRDCHTPPDSTPDGALTIDGVPETFEPRHKYTITVTIARGSGPWPFYGFGYAFQLNVSGGSLEIVDAGITMANGPREVQSRGVLEVTEWTLVWTAPETDDDVSFFCEAVVGDGDGSQSGDIPYRATGKAYGPLDVSPEDPAGPYEGRWAIIGIVAVAFLVVGYLIIIVKMREPGEAIEEEEEEE